MRISELNLVAFGPFTEKVLSFDKTGLHIVYGPNEAGKSSALRALKYLLYGIPTRTTDNFLHANDRLRIAGSLLSDEGDELWIARRKGRKNTLLGQDEEVLDEQALAPFLQGLTAELFETIFGIDHQGLIAGGQEILEQKGEVGQALFSASLGSHALRGVQAQLDEQADALFRPRGSTQTINSALKAHADLSKKIREHSLSSREWDEHRRALRRTEKDLEKVQTELNDQRLEVTRLQRIQRVLPRLARRRELVAKLERMEDVVVLPGHFAMRRQEAVGAMETARTLVGKAKPRLQGLRDRLEDLPINEQLLEQAETIEHLHARLGAHRKAMRERPGLDAEMKQLRTGAQSLIKGIRPDLGLQDAEQLHAVLAQRMEIVELGGQRDLLKAGVEQSEDALRETRKRLKAAEKARAELPELRNTESLRSAIAGARKLGDLDASIRSAQSELAILKGDCGNALARLSLWKGELDDVVRLSLPSRQTIQRYETDFDQLKSQAQRLEEKRSEVGNALHEVSVRLDEVVCVGEVPTESALAEMRKQRDQVWSLLRRQWVEDEDVSAEASVYEAEGPLPNVFEQRLNDTDEVSDRLRREADRVHALASLQAKQDGADAQARKLAQELEGLGEEKSRLDHEWQELWTPCHLVPATPREMRAWMDEFERLRNQVEQSLLEGKRIRELQHRRTTQVQRLNDQMVGLGNPGIDSDELEPVVLACEMLADRLEAVKRQHETLMGEVRDREADVESLADEHRSATAAMDSWKQQWSDLMKNLGLAGDMPPSSAHEFIENVRALFAKLDEAEKLRIRVQAIDEDADDFDGEVVPLVAGIAPDLADLSPDDAVGRLNTLLTKNQANWTKRQHLEEQIEETAQDVAEAEASIQAMSDRLDELCTEAKCDEHSELEEAERRSTEFGRLKAEITSLEQEIQELGGGIGMSELEAEVAGIEPDALPGQIDELMSNINDELEPKRTELAQAKGREEKELEMMDGSDQAAQLADQAQAVLATIRADAERYVQVKLAGKILRDQIEDYRRENQGPLISRASEHFSSLTLGSFAGLETDFNDKDEPVLVGARPNGDKVYVEGMSSGTRDQLYLSLRLASLERYMDGAESMPFIVDDILVEFDDARSEAALREMSVLAQKGQVILFTHHARVVEQAKEISADGSVTVHDL